MSEYETYSFSRLFLNRDIEFFFILGVNDSDNFDEYWDGRTKEVLGYAVIFNNSETKEQENFIFLIDKANRNYENIIKYTKKFIAQMTISEELSDSENFKIIKTEITERVVTKPYEHFIKKVIKNEIPESVLNELD